VWLYRTPPGALAPADAFAIVEREGRLAITFV